MARTTINSQGVPVGTITASDLSYPLTDFSSTGIDDNAVSTAITIDSTGKLTQSSSSNIAAAFSSTSTTAKLTLSDTNDTAFIDVNATRLGIGHSSSTSTQALQIEPTSAEAMRIDSSGQVIILGTNGSTTNSLDLSYNGTSGQATIQADSSGGSTFLTFGTSASGTVAERMRITSAGNVGIGTTSPSQELHVKGTGTVAQFEGSGGSGFIQITDSDDGTHGFVGVDAGKLKFQTSGSSYSDKMVIDTAGDISVGSASNHSGARIVINDTPPTAFGSPMLQVGQETFTASGYYSIGLGYTAGSYTEPPAEIAAVSTSSSGGTTADIVFGTRSVTTNTAVTERMRIKGQGEIQIGGTTNAGFIDFDGTSLQLNVQRNPNTGAFVNTSKSHAGITLLGSSGGSEIRFYTASADNTVGTERARINSSGNVAIGNTGNSTVRLRVLGSHSDSNNYAIEVANSSGASMLTIRNDGLYHLGLRTNSPYNFTTSNTANAYLNSSGGLQRSTSSRRYKREITDMPYGLFDVMNLRPVTFKGINDKESRRFGGFIAEEVHDAGLTEFVDYNTEDEPDALAYGNMVALLTKAIQELEAKVAALEAN